MVVVHHTDDYGVKWKNANETKLLNEASGSWVKPTGNIGRKILNNLRKAPREGMMRLPVERPREFGGRDLKLINKTYTGAVPRARRPPRNEEQMNLLRRRDFKNVGFKEMRWETASKMVNGVKIPLTLSFEKYADAVWRNRERGQILVGDNLVNIVNKEFVDVLFKNIQGSLDSRRTIPLDRYDTKEKFLNRLLELDRKGGVITIASDAEIKDRGGVPDLSKIVYKYTYNPQFFGGKTTNYKAHKSKLFFCLSPKSTGNNCLFIIIKQQAQLSEQAKTLRRMTGIEDDAMVNINQMRLIEDTFEVAIDVYDDTHEINKQGEIKYGYYYKSQKDPTYERIELLLEDEHFYLITKKKKIKIKPIKKKDKKVRYLIYDFETVFDFYEDSFLRPYSVSWYDISEEDFCNWNYTEIEDKKCGFYCGFDCVEKLFEIINNCPEDERYVIVGYNSSRFDNFFILDYCNSKNIAVDPFIANGKLNLDLSGGHSTLDLCRFTMCSLNSACKSFSCNPKKVEGFSHYEIQCSYEELNPKNEFIKHWIGVKELENYNKKDVLATMDLFYKVRKALIEVTKLDMCNFMTLASLTYKMCELSWEEKEGGYGKPAVIVDVDLDFRKSLYGGRTQVFHGDNGPSGEKVHYIEDAKDMRMVDVTSLYPYVMINRDYPIGEEIRTKFYVKGKLGIYKCKIKNRDDKYNIMPFRTKENPLDWNNKEYFDCWLTTIDIDCLHRHNFDCKVEHGYFWEHSADDVYDCMKPLENKKKQQDWFKNNEPHNYNPALRAIYKLLLNSLSGKMAQRNFTDKTIVVKSHAKLSSCKGKIVNISAIKGGALVVDIKYEDHQVYSERSKPSHLSSFIYSYARTYMYDTCISKMPVWYMDTDSALIHKRDMDKVKLGKEFGDFDEEIYNEKLGMIPKTYYAVAPKFYAIFNQNPKYDKIRVKGINPNGVIIPKEDEEKIKERMEEDPIESRKELYHLYHSGEYKKAYCEELFKRKLAGDKVQILCSQLTKKIYTTSQKVEDGIGNLKDIYEAKIKQTMMIKEI